MPEEQPQGHGQASQQRGFDPSIYRPVSMSGLVKMSGGGMPPGGMPPGGMPPGGMPTAQKAGSIGVGSRVRDQEKGNTGEIIAVEKNTRVYDGRPHSYITSITMRTDAGEEYHVRRSALKLIMPEPSEEEEAAIDPALARIVEMLNKPSTSCGSPISKRPSSPRNRSAPGSRLAHQAVSPRRNKSTPARLAQRPQPPAERRYDTDGVLYTMAEFVGYYGGTAEWEAARRQQQPQLAQLAQEGQLQRPPPLQSTSSRRPRGACILSAPSQPSPLQGTWPAGGAAAHQHQAEPAPSRVCPTPT